MDLSSPLAEGRDTVAVPLSTSFWQPPPGEQVPGRTVGEALSLAAAAWPGATALVDGGDPSRRWTFAELERDARQAARVLACRYAPGEHVGVWAASRPEWVVFELAAAIAGLVLVTVNPAFGEREAEYVLSGSEAVSVIADSSYRRRDLAAAAARLRNRLPGLRDVLLFDEWDAFTAQAEPADLPPVRPGDACQIQYTSGTTGFPKGAVLSQHGLTGNAAVFAQAIGATDHDVWLNPMPLFHTAGCGLGTLGALQSGGAQVLMPAFDGGTALELIADQQATILLAVPTMMTRILTAQETAKRELPSWRLWAVGGAPVPPDLVRRAEGELGLRVAIGFGQTECSPYISHTRPDAGPGDWRETVGQPLPGVSVRISDTATGEVAPLGRPGEIHTRSDFVMLGYHGDPAATAAVIGSDGWLHTGDLGTMDEHGCLRVTGRLKDMIIRGGENVYPREVEDVLFEHPSVRSAAVVGLPDPEWGEVVAAAVDAREPVDEKVLEAFCRSRLASFKVPRIWSFTADFPLTASGKVRKFELREQLLAGRDTPGILPGNGGTS